eukprot:5129755-Amphidinium_carterae.1
MHVGAQQHWRCSWRSTISNVHTVRRSIHMSSSLGHGQRTQRQLQTLMVFPVTPHEHSLRNRGFPLPSRCCVGMAVSQLKNRVVCFYSFKNTSAKGVQAVHARNSDPASPSQQIILLCVRGVQYPTHNGQPGQYCSLTCRNADKVACVLAALAGAVRGPVMRVTACLEKCNPSSRPRILVDFVFH